MTDIKIKKSVIEAWDWHALIGASFPEWFHEYVEEELSQSGVSYGDGCATVFDGPHAVGVFESAYMSVLLVSVPSIGTEQYAEVKEGIEKARTTYDLDNKATRVVVWC